MSQASNSSKHNSKTIESHKETHREITVNSETGAAVFVTPEELQKVGIDPAQTDAVELHIKNGQLELVETR